MAWDIRTDSPLLPYQDSGRGRADFRIPSNPRPRSEEVTGLLAGVAEVDITPPPGMPKAGYSKNACDGSGFRTRLRSRVLHLRSGKSSIAIVFNDLLGGSRVVQRLVARAVAEHTDIPIEGVYIGGTHTHAGPGQFLGSDFYNRFAANRPGFDPAWTQFLAEQITGAVLTAYRTRRPAAVAVGTTQVWGSTRNRSLKAHIRSPEATVTDAADQRRFQAINPDLHLIRVDGVGESRGPMGAFAVFSVHGTGVSEHLPEYNADIWAYLCGELAARVEQDSGVRPVVGAMEGTHGDIAPAIRPHLAVYDEAKRVGREIGARAAHLWRELAPRLDTNLRLAASLREVDVRSHPEFGGVKLPKPAVGAPLVAGADENATPVICHVPPFRAGSSKPHRSHDPQGAKWIVGSRLLQPLLVPTDSFPNILPVHAIRLGGALLVGLPFEITCGAGRRIAASVSEALPSGDGWGPDTRVIVSSVANEYVGYCTTPEEYQRQHYEGGHTIYGPGTVTFFAAHAGDVAAGLAGGETEFPDTDSGTGFQLKTHRYFAKPEGRSVPREFTRRPVFHMPSPRESGYWELGWRDVAPGDLHWYEPLATVQSRDSETEEWGTADCADGSPAADTAWNVEIIYDGTARNGGHNYTLRWFDPQHWGGRRYRVVLHPNAGRPRLVSPVFD